MKTSGLVMRPATRDDLPTIVAMLADDEIGQSREDASNSLDRRYTDAFDAIVSDPNQLLAIADIDGEAAGCLQLSFLPGISRHGTWRGQIEGVRIAAERRGTGVGRSMLEWAIAECRERGCGLAQLTSDKRRPEAIAFYEALGFEASHAGLKLSL